MERAIYKALGREHAINWGTLRFIYYSGAHTAESAAAAYVEKWRQGA